MANLLEVDEKNWESEVLNSDKPVLVDFWAPWCGPCRALSPTVEALAQEWEGKVKVAKCNTDDAGPVAAKYGVMGIPALILFKDGKVVHQLQGNQPKQRIVDQLSSHIG